MSLMFHTKFHHNQPSGSWRDNVDKCFHHIYEHDSHLGHVTIIILILFISMYLQAYIQNLAERIAQLFLIKGLNFICN